MSKDYYSVLGVDKSASQEEIKKAYRKLAHQHHPDKQGGNEAKFKEVNEAYQTLGNKDKRAQYDQFGTTFDSAGMGAGGSAFGGNWQDFARQYGTGNQYQGFRTNVNFDDFDLGDIFGDLFGFSSRGNNRARSRSGEDIQITMEIEFQEAVFGAEKIISFEKYDVCSRCNGAGSEPDSKIITCPECHGSGRITQSQRTIFGVFQSATVCPTCKGKGNKPERFCRDCHGQGRVQNKKELKIKIPAGISAGETIKISGQGNVGIQGSGAGDLYISFNIKQHSHFKREDYNILSQKQITVPQAALGDKVEVDTVDGLVSLKIPSGTQSGKVFFLKNKGVPVLNRPGSRGDHLVEVIVKIPTKLSRKQKKLLEELKSEL